MVTFSVVVPTHDDGSKVLDAIESVRAQTLRDFELIVVDDGSTDDTRARLRSVQDPRLVIVRQDRAGVSAARNAGAAVATGRFLTFLDSDDVARKDWLAEFAGELEREGVGVVCAGARMVQRDTHTLLEVIEPSDGGALFRGRQVLFLAGTFAVDRALFREVGGYSAELAHSENTDLGIRLVSHCLEHGREIGVLRHALVEYRTGPGGTSLRAPARAGRERQMARLGAVNLFLRRHGDLLRKDSDLLCIYLTLGGVSAARCGRLGLAASYLARAVRSQPRRLKSYARLFYLLHPGVPAAIRNLFTDLTEAKPSWREIAGGEGLDELTTRALRQPGPGERR